MMVVSWVHLFNNLVVQMVLGVLLEMVHTWRIVVIYLAGVAGGALANSLYLPTFYLAGASGGVYAVEYAHLSNLILVRCEKDTKVGVLSRHSFFSPFAKSQVRKLLIFYT